MIFAINLTSIYVRSVMQSAVIYLAMLREQIAGAFQFLGNQTEGKHDVGRPDTTGVYLKIPEKVIPAGIKVTGAML